MIHYEIDRVLLENHSTPQKKKLVLKDPKDKEIYQQAERSQFGSLQSGKDKSTVVFGVQETGIPPLNINGQIKKKRTRKIDQLPTPPQNITPNNHIQFPDYSGSNGFNSNYNKLNRIDFLNKLQETIIFWCIISGNLKFVVGSFLSAQKIQNSKLSLPSVF